MRGFGTWLCAGLMLASCGDGSGGSTTLLPATPVAPTPTPTTAPIAGPDYTAFGAETPVAIAGYTDNAMEPFIAKDGQMLFFNSSNAPGVDTDLFYATRQTDGSFASQGRIMGANSASLDAVASLDATGNFYFVSLRTYDATSSSIYSGRLAQGALSPPVLVDGVSRKIPGTIEFDAEVSKDGQLLIVADGVFTGKATPDSARLVMLDRQGTGFARRADSDALLANVNTNGLNYAPAISTDGLELFFTRIPDIAAPGPVIYRATRASTVTAFAAPQRVSAITGYAEAPTLSDDGKTLFYHKQVNGVFGIYKVVRP